MSGVLNSTPVIYFKFSELALVNKLVLIILFLAVPLVEAKVGYVVNTGHDIVSSFDLDSGEIKEVFRFPEVDAMANISLKSPSLAYFVSLGGSKFYEVNFDSGAYRIIRSDSIGGEISDIKIVNSSTAYVVSISEDNILKLNLETGSSELLLNIPGTPGISGIATVDLSTAYLVGLNDNNIYRVNLSAGTYECLANIPGSPSLRAIALASSKQAYVVGQNDNNIYLIDLETGEFSLVTSEPLEGAGLFRVAVDGGKIYALGTSSSSLYAVDIATGAVRTLAIIPGVDGTLPTIEGMAIGSLFSSSAISLANLMGNNLILAVYLNNNAPEELLVAFTGLGAVQLNQALNEVLPTRNTFVTYASQKNLLTSARVLSNRLNQLRYQFKREQNYGMKICKNAKDYLGFEEQDSRENRIYSFWGAPFLNSSCEKERSQTPALTMCQAGGQIGFEAGLGRKNILGVGATYVFTAIDHDRYMGSARLHQGNISLYGQCDLGSAYVQVVLAGGCYSSQNQRKIFFGSVNQTATSLIGGWQFLPHVEIGYKNFECLGKSMKQLNLEPFVAFDWVLNREKSFIEEGAGNYNMGQDGRFASLVGMEYGVRLHKVISCNHGNVEFREKISYLRQIPFGIGRISAFLAGSKKRFEAEIFTQAQNIGIAEFSATYSSFKDPLSFLGVSYHVEGGLTQQSHRVMLEFSYTF